MEKEVKKSKKGRVVAIIQARSASTRLPGNVLMNLCDKSILQHVIDRVAKSQTVDEVIVATTMNHQDLPIVLHCGSKGVRVYAGSENNVLDRYYQTARHADADHIIRITSDCPMIDPKEIDRVVKEHLSGDFDYTSNSIDETCADGQDVEIFSIDALERSWKEAEMMSELEHVTQYIKKHPEIFTINNAAPKLNLSAKRWTVDNPEDFAFATEVFERLYPKDNYFGIDQILQLLNDSPELEKINGQLERNEGLKKSLREDKKAIKKEKI